MINQQLKAKVDELETLLGSLKPGDAKFAQNLIADFRPRLCK